MLFVLGHGHDHGGEAHGHSHFGFGSENADHSGHDHGHEGETHNHGHSHNQMHKHCDDQEQEQEQEPESNISGYKTKQYTQSKSHHQHGHHGHSHAEIDHAHSHNSDSKRSGNKTLIQTNLDIANQVISEKPKIKGNQMNSLDCTHSDDINLNILNSREKDKAECMTKNLENSLIGHSHCPLGNIKFGTDSIENENISSKKSAKNKNKRVENMNLYAAYLHIMGDLIQSIGVCIASILIWFNPSQTFWDPVCTLLFAGLVVCTTVSPTRLALNILMEGTPGDVDVGALEADLLSCCSVRYINDLHIWAISPNKNVMTVSLVTTDHKCCYNEADQVAQKYKIYHSTIQTICVDCEKFL